MDGQTGNMREASVSRYLTIGLTQHETEIHEFNMRVILSMQFNMRAILSIHDEHVRWLQVPAGANQ